LLKDTVRNRGKTRNSEKATNTTRKIKGQKILNKNRFERLSCFVFPTEKFKYKQGRIPK